MEVGGKNEGGKGYKKRVDVVGKAGFKDDGRIERKGMECRFQFIGHMQTKQYMLG